LPHAYHTYNAERHAKAAELIEFDREMARLISARDTKPDTFQHYFIKHGRYTAGVETQYSISLLTAIGTHQHLAEGYPIGKRFHSAQVIRLGDAKPMQLAHPLLADGRWRLFLFADGSAPDEKSNALNTLCDYLIGEGSPIVDFTAPGHDIDSIIDVRIVLQQMHREVELETLHALLLPTKGRYGLIDYEKVYCPHSQHGENIFDSREINRDVGCMVIVRPDQYVANVLPMHATEELYNFFSQILLTQGNNRTPD